MRPTIVLLGFPTSFPIFSLSLSRHHALVHGYHAPTHGSHPLASVLHVPMLGCYSSACGLSGLCLHHSLPLLQLFLGVLLYLCCFYATHFVFCCLICRDRFDRGGGGGQWPWSPSNSEKKKKKLYLIPPRKKNQGLVPPSPCFGFVPAYLCSLGYCLPAFLWTNLKVETFVTGVFFSSTEIT
jgi:hypothetical protein